MSDPSLASADVGNDDDPALDAEPPVLPLPQPQNCQITIERFPDGLTINVPPGGLWRGSQGLFFFSLVWNGFFAVLTPAFVLGMFQANRPEPWAILILPAVLSLFWLVGIGILLGSINMGRRRAAIAVTGGTLMVIQTGPFGSKQRDWTQADIERVCAGPSGMEVNHKPILELQVYGRGTTKFGLLAGRRDDELFWIASELRTALGVTESAS